MAKSWSSRGCVAGLAAAVLASFVLVPAGPAAAGKDHGKHDKAPKVVARGLDNPRHVRVAGDALYVAESGSGAGDPALARGRATRPATATPERSRGSGTVARRAS